MLTCSLRIKMGGGLVLPELGINSSLPSLHAVLTLFSLIWFEIVTGKVGSTSLVEGPSLLYLPPKSSSVKYSLVDWVLPSRAASVFVWKNSVTVGLPYAFSTQRGKGGGRSKIFLTPWTIVLRMP